MTLKEIDKQINELNNKRRELEKQEREKFKEQAKVNIGRCFIINNKKYAKVIDIPKEEYTMTSVRFNEYQYPAIYLDETEDVPFYYDNLFSGAWGIGNDFFDTYKEITQEEFNMEFDRVMQKFKNNICGK